MCDVRPQDLVINTWETIGAIWRLFVGVIHDAIGTMSWAFQYILLGAVVVVPIALLGWLFRLGGRRG